MKKKIAEYVTPDLSELNKKLEVTMQNSEKSVQYTQDIKNDLKQDIRRLEKVVEQVERDGKQLNREVDQDMRQIRKEIDSKIQKALDNPLAGK
jgi:t-SNARE complex subunit (syntaxin)